MISRCVYAFLSVRFVADGLSAAEAGVVLVVCTLVTIHIVVFLENNDNVDEVQRRYAFLCSVLCVLPFVLGYLKRRLVRSKSRSFPFFLPRRQGSIISSSRAPVFHSVTTRSRRGQGI